jgi:hypothetical protein
MPARFPHATQAAPPKQRHNRKNAAPQASGIDDYEPDEPGATPLEPVVMKRPMPLYTDDQVKALVNAPSPREGTEVAASALNGSNATAARPAVASPQPSPAVPSPRPLVASPEPAPAGGAPTAAAAPSPQPASPPAVLPPRSPSPAVQPSKPAVALPSPRRTLAQADNAATPATSKRAGPTIVGDTLDKPAVPNAANQLAEQPTVEDAATTLVRN